MDNPFWKLEGDWTNEEKAKINKMMSDSGIIYGSYPVVHIKKSSESQFSLKIGKLPLQDKTLDGLLSKLSGTIKTVEAVMSLDEEEE